MNEGFRKYLGYAIGELLLVIIGILVALQINNWADDRKKQATLQAYLESIARNMREDLAELETLRELRLQTLEAAARHEYLRVLDAFTVPQVFMVNRILVLATDEHYFSANTNGIEALKSSGVLDRLQGMGVQSLISAYYDIVRQVELLESSHYEYVRPQWAEVMRLRHSHVESFAVTNPSALLPERFEALQPMYRELIQSPVVEGIALSGGKLLQLVRYYDSLRVLAEAFEAALENGIPEGDAQFPRTPANDWNEKIAVPVLVDQGRPAWEFYWLVGASGPSHVAFKYDFFERSGDHLDIHHGGGAAWSSVYFSQDRGDAGRPHMDFSHFNKLLLELKGAQGGEVLLVHVKDAEYPDHLAPISVPITLTNQWQTYEIDLAEFAPNDLSRLHVPLGFLFEAADKPATISIRNARYH